jgi:hypothetical protein
VCGLGHQKTLSHWFSLAHSSGPGGQRWQNERAGPAAEVKSLPGWVFVWTGEGRRRARRTSSGGAALPVEIRGGRQDSLAAVPAAVHWVRGSPRAEQREGCGGRGAAPRGRLRGLWVPQFVAY